MVSDDPESFADLDGHADDDIVDHILNFVVSAGTTWLSDNAFGAFRPSPQSVEGKLGQAVGDFAAQHSGIAEAEAGTAGLGSSRAMALVPGGQEEAAGSGIVSEAAVLHGTATAAIGTVNLAKDVAENSTSSKPHGNTAGDQPAELYEKHDANGNFEKHGVSQDASKRYSKKEVNGGTVKVTERGPRKAEYARRQAIEGGIGSYPVS
jgi:hypothetical protein